MKNVLLLLTVAFSLNINAQQKTLDENNLKVAVSNNSDSAFQFGIKNHKIKNGGDSMLLYGMNLWMGGVVDKELRFSGGLYGQLGLDFLSGPLDINTAQTDSNRVKKYKKVWEISKAEIEIFLDNGIVSQNMKDWPAGSNRSQISGNESPSMAPFVDVNNDNLYEPTKGDYPKMKGDKMLWWVYNDRGVNRETKGKSIGVEIAVSAYQYYCDSFQKNSVNAVINNTTFYDYKIVYRGTETLTDFRIGLFSDLEIGKFNDDLAACDSNLNVSYGYNNLNRNGGKQIGNVLYLGGVVNNKGKSLDLSSNITFNNNADFVQGNPKTDNEYYNYLRGNFRNGTQPNSKFFGHQDTLKQDSGLSFDKRRVMSCGPLTLLPGSVHFFNAAVFQTSDQGSFAKTEKLNKARLLALQKYYDKDSLPRCGQYALSTQDIEDIEKKVIVFPNPSNGNFSIKWDLMNVEVKNVSILNNIGKEVYSQEKFQGTNQINLKNMYLTSGLYFVNVNTNNGVITKKVIVK